MGEVIEPISDEVSDELKAVLVGDIHRLRSEIATVGERIEALAPMVSDVDEKWLLSKKQSLATEFQEIVKDTLDEECRSALKESNRMLAKASDSLNVTASEIKSAHTRSLFMGMFIGLLTGICSVIVTLYLFFSVVSH